MAAKLATDKTITREMQFRFLPAPVNVTLSADGVAIAAKGCRQHISIDWQTLVDRCKTENSVPAKFYNRGAELLQHQMKPTVTRLARFDASIDRMGDSAA